MLTAFFYTLWFGLPIVIAITLAITLVYAGVRLTTSLRFGVFLILAYFCLDTWFLGLPALSVGLNIYPQDLLFTGLAVIGLGRFFLGTNTHAGTIAWTAFGAFLFVSFVIGAAKYGSTAGVDLRPTFYFWATAQFMGSFRVDKDLAERIVRYLLIVGVVLFFIVVYRWVSDAFGWGTHLWRDVGAGTMRVLNAGQAYLFAMLTILLAWANARGRMHRPWSWLLPLFFLIMVLLQHRSVWVATASGLLVLYIASPALRPRYQGYAVLAAVATVLAMVPLLAYGLLDTVFDSLLHSGEEVFQQKSTLTWRLQSTQELLGQWVDGGPLVYLIGKPFGSGYERYLLDLTHDTNYSPHNFYVQMLLRVGLMGLVAVAVAYGYCISRLWKARAADDGSGVLGATSLVAMLVANVVIFFPYGSMIFQGLFLGIAMAMCQTQVVAHKRRVAGGTPACLNQP